jgi:hypothetical protein
MEVRDVEAGGVFMGAAGTAFWSRIFVLMRSHVRAKVNMTITRTDYGAFRRYRLLTLKAAFSGVYLTALSLS